MYRQLPDVTATASSSPAGTIDIGYPEDGDRKRGNNACVVLYIHNPGPRDVSLVAESDASAHSQLVIPPMAADDPPYRAGPYVWKDKELDVFLLDLGGTTVCPITPVVGGTP